MQPTHVLAPQSNEFLLLVSCYYHCGSVELTLAHVVFASVRPESSSAVYCEVVLNGVGLVVLMLAKTAGTNYCKTRWTALCDESPHSAVMGLTPVDEGSET